MERLFVYGILRFPKYQKRVFGRVVASTPSRISGFRKTQRMMPDGRYFVVVPARGRSVLGKVLLVSKRELARADREEVGYHRIRTHSPEGRREWVYTPKVERHHASR